MSKSLRIQLEVDIHAVTCPGVWFSRKGPVFLAICFLGHQVKTKPFPPSFPFLFGDKFVFEKTFPGCSNLAQLQTTLDHQPLYVELLQDASGPDFPPIVLATFETSGLEFLFPYPQLRPTYNSGVDVDLLMEPTREFPGVISPKIEASTRCHINETRQAHLDQLHDSVVTVNETPPMMAHPHLTGRNAANNRSRSSSEERGPLHSEPFAWRRVDEDLLYRKPDGDATPHECDHANRSSRPFNRSSAMRRSKSAVWGGRRRQASQNRSSDNGQPRSASRERGRSKERRPPPPPCLSRPPSVHREYFYRPPLPPSPPPPPLSPLPARLHCRTPTIYPPACAPSDPFACPYSCHVPPDPYESSPPYLVSRPRLYRSSHNLYQPPSMNFGYYGPAYYM